MLSILYLHHAWISYKVKYTSFFGGDNALKKLELIVS